MGLFEEDEEIELKASVLKLLAVEEDMKTFCDETPGFVRWVETEEKNTTLRMSPIYPSEFIKSNLLPEYNSILLTSATLSVSGDFSLMENTLGVNGSKKLSVPSPFDMRNQVSVQVKKGIDLRDKDSIEKLAGVIIEEAGRAEGR